MPEGTPALRFEGPKADLHHLLVALIKLALVSDDHVEAPWRDEAREAQQRVAIAAAEVATLRLDDRWTLAVKAAEANPVVRRDETVNPMLPTRSPVTVQHLVSTPFDLDATVQTIRDVASFG